MTRPTDPTQSDYKSREPTDPDAQARLRFEELTAILPGKGRPSDSPDLPDLPLADLEPPREPPRERPGGVLPRPVLGEGGGGPSFSMDLFVDGLRQRLRGNCKGWAFAVNQNGQLLSGNSDAGGLAVDGNDTVGGVSATQRQMSENVRMNIASVSKTITAVAVLRLLGEAGIGTLSPIWPYLPPSWTLGPQADELTFHQLLTHRSGLTSTNNNFNTTLSDAGLAAAIANGANPGAPYNYLNANYALFRVIIPALWRTAGHPAANNDNPTASAFFYAVYIIEEIFGRMGGAFGENASTSPLDSNPTRYYQNAAATVGSAYNNWAMIAGGGGWHLSATELAAFLSFITYSDEILDATQRNAMDQLLYGWQPSIQGTFGTYRFHSGSISNNTNAPFPAVRTAIMKFNIQVEASLIVNSQITGSNDSAAQLLVNAYEAAWS